MPYTCRNKTVYFNGEDKGVVQDYLVIHKDLMKNKKLFEDDKFPANDSSLYFNEKPSFECVWKRPGEIVKNPRFIVDGASRFDIKQGGLGDCWMLAGMANLTTHPELQTFVVPSRQSFKDDYAGIFHFRLWRQGRWTDVVVDDRLPTAYGQLAYAKSTVGNEFWSSLLEKAYAKVFGSYEAISGGLTIESMVDLSGGVPEIIMIEKEKPNHLFDVIQQAHARRAWLTCSIFAGADPESEEGKKQAEEKENKYGLIVGHAYTLTGVRRVEFDNKEGKQKLVRIRNPWGNETEWKGAYADESEEWKHITQEERRKLNLEFENDGEYWMHFSDFRKHFSIVEICHLSPDIFRESANEFGGKYTVTIHHGSWSIKDGTAGGGSPENLEMFKKNPQYTVVLKDADECPHEHDDDDEDAAAEDNEKCTLIVSLMQKNKRVGKKDGLETFAIGFVVYHVPDPDKWSKQELKNRFLKTHEPLYASGEACREYSARLRVKPGTYLIIPITQEPNQEASFMLRILTEKPVECHCIG